MGNTQQRVLQYMSPVWWLCNGREEGGSCPVATAVAKPEIVYRRKTARTKYSQHGAEFATRRRFGSYGMCGVNVE